MKYLKYFLGIFLFLPIMAQAQFLFHDATSESKVFQQSVGTENIGPGVVVLDFDNDGWDDLYLPGGLDSDKLYRNMHDGTFMDVSTTVFKFHYDSLYTHTRGGTAFDFDNDGFTDIYATTQGTDILWRNNGDGTFTNVSVKAGIIPTSLNQNESNGASFGDFNGDGYNDLYVARWVDEFNNGRDSQGQTISYENRGFPNWLYVNNGDGTFTERAKELKVDGDTGCSNIGLFFDYDRDGDLDILIGNDFGVQEMPNRVFKNMLMETGKATFVDVTDSVNMGSKLFSMGIGPNDYNRDGQFDFYETSVGPELLMQNNSNIFTNVAKQANISTGFDPGYPNRMTTTWTPLFADFDNDGWEDGFITHGFISIIPPWSPINNDTSRFLRNIGGVFEDYTDSSGYLFFGRGRGAAIFDYDHDGKMDIALGSLGVDDPPGILWPDFKIIHNVTPSGNATEGNIRHWLEMRFTATRTAKEGIGTIVDVWAGGAVRSRQVNTGGGQGSCNTLMQHVGLGKYTKADSIIIYWPCDKYRNRTINKYYNVAADTLLHYTEDTTVRSGVTYNANPSLDQVKIYPTPARNILNIENLQPSIVHRFEIYDLLGIRRLDLNASDKDFSLSVGSLKPGCYVLRITSNGIAIAKQFIKE